MKILQINTTVNSGSTGRIAENIGKVLMAAGHESTIAFGRGNRPSESKLIRIGGAIDVTAHAAHSLVSDRHGFGSANATRALIREIERLSPDIIGLHNLHGYYINVDVLFSFLRGAGVPIIWTLHDCWAFTGHCAYYDFVGCKKWQEHCHTCPLTSRYPRSLFRDNSRKNFSDKRKLFSGIDHLKLITPSRWLKGEIAKSFLSEYEVDVIHNGIDLQVFNVRETETSPKKLILGVASTWDRIKGLPDFYELRERLPESYDIVIIGASRSLIKKFPPGMRGIERTENVHELVHWYNAADVFVNPTYVDNFPTTNLESLACGTPVITYQTGGSPEAIDDKTGIVVPRGDKDALIAGVKEITGNGKAAYQQLCRARAQDHFDKDDRFGDYLRLYQSFLPLSND